MFTDEKIEMIYAKDGISGLKEIIRILLDVCKESTDFKVGLRKANNIWKLFASRHVEISQDGFRNFLNEVSDSKHEEELKQILK